MAEAIANHGYFKFCSGAYTPSIEQIQCKLKLNENRFRAIEGQRATRLSVVLCPDTNFCTTKLRNT